MKKDIVYNIAQFAIIILCLLFLGYRIANDDITAVADSFTDNFAGDTCRWLVVAVVLLPVNILLEAIKWRKAIENVVSVSLCQSLRSVLWGYTGAFISPNSVAEYPTRSMNLPQGVRTQAVAMGFVGSLIQTVVITLFGVVGLLLELGQLNVSHTAIALVYVAAAVLLIVSVFFFLKMDKIGRCLGNSRLAFIGKIAESLSLAKHRQLRQLFIICTLKYATFCVQFLSVLIFCGVEISIYEAFVSITVFYLLLTFTPLVNIFEVAVRSSIAILVFGSYAPNATSIVVASTIFWLINFCLPSFVGIFFFKRERSISAEK